MKLSQRAAWRPNSQCCFKAARSGSVPRRGWAASCAARALFTSPTRRTMRATGWAIQCVAPWSTLLAARTYLAVPLRSGEVMTGAFTIYRREVRLFTERQIALLQTFAAQAAIAIENARLFNETKEALERQTATADILKVIASSPDNVQPVFQAIADRSKRLVDALSTTVFGLVDGMLHLRAFTPTTPQADARLQASFPAPLSTFSWGKAIAMGGIYRVIDAEQEPERLRELARERGWRSALLVPLLRDGKPIGMIGPTRAQPGPFTEHHVQLMQTFADQAVIAIQNVELFEEVQARTRDLTESLQQQTATSEVLQVISSSQGELGPVFHKMLENATRVCGAGFGAMNLVEGETMRRAALYNAPPAFAAALGDKTLRIHPQSSIVAAISSKRVVQVEDMRQSPSYIAGAQHAVELTELGGARTIVVVPMLRDDEAIGVITVYRQEVRPFSEKQVELLTNFARQAVIAIENSRLISETREALEQQTATSEVLKVISSSPGDLKPVFSSMLENAVSICDAKFGNLFLVDGDTARWEAGVGTPPKLAEFFTQSTWFRPTPGSHLARVLRTKEVSHTADDTAEAVIGVSARLGGARSTVCVPMVKDDTLVGAIFIYRTEVRPFTDKQIDLVRNFAAQAVIAIENARLLKELRERTDDLSASLDDLRTAQNRLVQTEKLASLGQLTAGIAHEIKNPLNFVNNFSALSAELVGEMTDALSDVDLHKGKRDELDEIAQMLKDNLNKVVQHGKRADAIVKNMLQHSREGSGEHRPVDINALVEESLNLAYHGARAEKPGFNVTLKRDLDPDAGAVELYPQEITRTLLNLISNGFYAAIQRKSMEGETFEPVLIAATKNLGKTVEIRIRDNGTGIPPDVKEKIFNPFFTTKPSGEGTGLGLSMSHDIVVKQHGGSIDVETEPGLFTEFKIVLPRTSQR